MDKVEIALKVLELAVGAKAANLDSQSSDDPIALATKMMAFCEAAAEAPGSQLQGRDLTKEFMERLPPLVVPEGACLRPGTPDREMLAADLTELLKRFIALSADYPRALLALLPGLTPGARDHDGTGQAGADCSSTR